MNIFDDKDTEALLDEAFLPNNQEPDTLSSPNNLEQERLDNLQEKIKERKIKIKNFIIDLSFMFIFILILVTIDYFFLFKPTQQIFDLLTN